MSCTPRDWLVATPAIALAEYFDVPLVSTIHATEAGRHSGWVAGSISRQVHAVESWLVQGIRLADHVFGVDERRDHQTVQAGLAEIRVIHNGIDAALWPFARRRPRQASAELLYLGRLEYEKGVHDAIAALPANSAHPRAPR